MHIRVSLGRRTTRGLEINAILTPGPVLRAASSSSSALRPHWSAQPTTIQRIDGKHNHGHRTVFYGFPATIRL